MRLVFKTDDVLEFRLDLNRVKRGSRQDFAVCFTAAVDSDDSLMKLSLEQLQGMCTSIGGDIHTAEEVRVLHERQAFLDGWITEKLEG